MIKKLSIIIAMSLFVSSTVFAAGSIDMGTELLKSADTGKTLYGAKADASKTSPLIGKTSTGIGLGVFTTAQGYAVTTVHMNGTKQFGTAYDSSSLFSKDLATKGTPTLGVPEAITTADFDGWASM